MSSWQSPLPLSIQTSIHCNIFQQTPITFLEQVSSTNVMAADWLMAALGGDRLCSVLCQRRLLVLFERLSVLHMSLGLCKRLASVTPEYLSEFSADAEPEWEPGLPCKQFMRHEAIQSGGTSCLWHSRYRRNRRWLCTRNGPLVRQRSRLSAQHGPATRAFVV